MLSLLMACVVGQICSPQPVNYVVQQQVQSYAVQQYVAPVQYSQYVQQPIVIGVPVNQLGLGYYYSVGDQLREERIAELVSQRLQAQLKAAPVTAPPAQPVTPEPPQPSVQPTPTSIDAQVLEIFTNSCLNCHKPGANGPGVKLFNEDGSLFVDEPSKELERRFKIWDVTFGGNVENKMPKGDSNLPDEEVEVLRQWVRSYKSN